MGEKKMKKLFVLVAIFLCSTVNAAEFRRAETFEDVHHATFRVTVSGARGTATFIGQDERGAILLTNHHVVSNAREATVEGWGCYDRKALRGVVDWRAYNKNEPYDFAEIVVDPEQLKSIYNPPYVALAGEDCDLDDAQIISAGAPRGAHVSTWKGVELGKYNGRTIMFTPPPVPGQSGSLIVARVDGELWGVAILTWLFGREGDDAATGGAIPIKLYYKARGVPMSTPASSPSLPPIPENAVEVADHARLRVYTSPNQCEPCAKLEPTLKELEAEGVLIERIDALGAHKELALKDGVENIPTIYAVNNDNKVVRVVTADELAENPKQTLLNAYKYATMPKEPTPAVEITQTTPKQETPNIVYSVASSNGIVDESLKRWRMRGKEEPEETKPQPNDTARPRIVAPIENIENAINAAAKKAARRAIIAIFFCVVAGVLVADSVKRAFLWLLAFLGNALRGLLKKMLAALEDKK